MQVGKHTAMDWWMPCVRRYAAATKLCMVFSAVYEYFSHGVISWWMVLLCAYPLVLGLVPATLFAFRGIRVPLVARQLWACGVMTLTVGSCLRGVFEIYGTTSPLVWPYLPVGLALLGMALIVVWKRSASCATA